MKEQHVIETLHSKKQQLLLANQVVKMIFKTTDDVRSLDDSYYTFIRFSQKLDFYKSFFLIEVVKRNFTVL